ncbi:MAG TPA: hypothetical protein VH251_10645 [Verrucomicrobiae bacterium]|nr:hypothetical protein [Verrucomicrobiae bacterium]
MTRKLLAGILIVLVVFGVLAPVKYFQVKAVNAASASHVAPPENISTAVAHAAKDHTSEGPGKIGEDPQTI